MLHRPSKRFTYYVKILVPVKENIMIKNVDGTYVQVPFVMFCQSGHIEDFPWNEWVHQEVINLIVREKFKI